MYLILSLSFIPISLLIRLANFGFVLNLLLIIFICVILYVGILFYKKDENLFLIINKFFGKLRKKQK